ncbi:MAG: DUF3576 domain-containing protein [Alphaproteobacteria bacterium]
MPRTHKTALSLLALIALGACAQNVQTEAKYPTGAERDGVDANNIYDKPDSIFGEDGLSLFGGKGRDREDAQSSIGVNSFLWRAALDTVSFMPLASADPFGGVILTDWYTPESTPDERVKINVFILGRQLRSDGVRVRVFKQVSQRGNWVDVEVSDETTRALEDTILTRAREMRIAQQ